MESGGREMELGGVRRRKVWRTRARATAAAGCQVVRFSVVGGPPESPERDGPVCLKLS
jgi:hypothetical protein